MLIAWKNLIGTEDSTSVLITTPTVNATGSGHLTRQIGDVTTFAAGTSSPQADQDIRFLSTWNTAQTFQVFGIMGHNFADGDGAQLLIQGSNTGYYSQDVFGSGWIELDDYFTGANDAANFFYVASSAFSCKYLTFRIWVYDNGGTVGSQSTYGQTWTIGRYWAGPIWEPTCSIDFSMGVHDRSRLTRSRGGQVWVQPRDKLREINVLAYGNSDADFFGTDAAPDDCFVAMDQAVGASNEIICIPRNDNAHERHRLGVYGSVVNNTPIRVRDRGASGLLTEKRFTVREQK